MTLFPHSSQAAAGRHGAGLWAVALAFLAVLAFSTVPTPLYAIYQARDGFSTFLITVIFAAYAVGVAGALFFAGHVSDWLGRRRTLVAALLLALVSAAVFLLWDTLPGLLVGRVLSGLAVGVVTATSTAFLVELHLAQRPGTSPKRAQIVATTANLGGLGLGPIVAGVLAETVASPLTVPYAVFAALLVVAVIAVALAPETVTRPQRRPAYRPQRVAVPAAARGSFFSAAAGAFVAFAAFGLFTSLAPSFLAGTLGHTNHALAGVPAVTGFGAAIVAQLAAGAWDVRRLVGTGTAALSAGLALLVTALWASSLALFLTGVVITGVGAGLLFKGGIARVSALAAASPNRAEVLAGFFLAGYLGLSVPVLGLGVASQFMAPKVALLGFAALLLVGGAFAARPRTDRERHGQRTDGPRAFATQNG
ncbi:MFS transporter [Solirubrobacter deserti]|uniref:MFS transporter n=1 Tax=Solirubrobacter deserti TaxID=2282478 RepID=A0ABT4RJW1_9ACTN|nr:MFS transporter [Solirubrobacter deserti]MDA0138785.1 MFS transporter [Solirubrobacter deserti]